MPQPIRIRPQAQVLPANGQQVPSVLTRIRKLVARNLGLKFSCYGEPKTGKTRFACTFPKPLLIIGFEDGTESVVGTEEVEFVQLAHTDEFTTLVEGPIKAGNYASVVVDNATRMRDMKLAELAGLSEVPVQKRVAEYKGDSRPGVYTRDHYRDAVNILKVLLAQLLDVSNKTEMNTVIIAQEANLVSDEDQKKMQGSDLIKTTIGSAVGKSLADFINAECDYIGQTCKREQLITTTTKVQGRDVQITRSTGKVDYCMRVGPHPIYYTGFRQHLDAPQLPDFITSPTYEKVLELIRGKAG